MGNFIKKHGATISFMTGITSVLSIAGAYIVSVIRDDKREIKRHKKMEEVYQSEIDYFRSETKKES